MADHPRNIVRLLEPEAESVGRARRAVADLAAGTGAPSDAVDRVRLVVSEVVTNAIEHGYDGSAGMIKLKASVRDGCIRVLVADDGRGLGASENIDGLGIGLEIAERLSDAFNVLRRSTGGVEVRVRFDLFAQEAPADSPLQVRRGEGVGGWLAGELDFSARRN